MTKQKEIREGIAKQLALQTLGDDGMDTIDLVWKWVVDNDFVGEYHEKAEDILAYLHSQGAVIKVDRELPETPYMPSGTMEGQYKGSQQDMLKAGYVAVEPLIEEKK